jgi:hypothetical protein
VQLFHRAGAVFGADVDHQIQHQVVGAAFQSGGELVVLHRDRHRDRRRHIGGADRVGHRVQVVPAQDRHTLGHRRGAAGLQMPGRVPYPRGRRGALRLIDHPTLLGLRGRDDQPGLGQRPELIEFADHRGQITAGDLVDHRGDVLQSGDGSRDTLASLRQTQRRRRRVRATRIPYPIHTENPTNPVRQSTDPKALQRSTSDHSWITSMAIAPSGARGCHRKYRRQLRDGTTGVGVASRLPLSHASSSTSVA